MSSEEEASLWEHLDALRRTLLQVLLIIGVGFLFSFWFYEEITALLTLPLGGLKEFPQLVLLSPIEGFRVALRLSFWGGLILTSPLWLYLLFRFIKPALKPEEKQLVFPFLFTSLLFLVAGGCFAVKIAIPAANRYLYAFNDHMGQNLWSLTEYMDYTVLLLLGNALAFELASLLLLAIHYGILSHRTLRKQRRLMIVLILIISALLTPPDVCTQLLMAGPLMVLYEGAILYGRLTERGTRSRLSWSSK